MHFFLTSFKEAFYSWCSFSMMVKWANDGLLQAMIIIFLINICLYMIIQSNDAERLVNDGEILVNDGEMFVKDGEMSICHTLISPSLTSISLSLTSILPSLAWSIPSYSLISPSLRSFNDCIINAFFFTSFLVMKVRFACFQIKSKKGISFKIYSFNL